MVAKFCASCGAALSGPFCAACGSPVPEAPSSPSTGHANPAPSERTPPFIAPTGTAGGRPVEPSRPSLAVPVAIAVVMILVVGGALWIRNRPEHTELVNACHAWVRVQIPGGGSAEYSDEEVFIATEENGGSNDVVRGNVQIVDPAGATGQSYFSCIFVDGEMLPQLSIVSDVHY